MNITKKQVAVKVEFKKEIRKIPGISSFDDLTATVKQLFNIETGALKFTYVDDEKETITVSNDEDLECMFDIFKDTTPKIFVIEEGWSSHVLENLELSSSIVIEPPLDKHEIRQAKEEEKIPRKESFQED